ncbi:DUF2971 domain-containing protein [Clostridium intestinale]|uniref:DUF2971 domain-containing protein n=1 Tax=Clostridium intestinale DSM 6191 TaxID=1121320 RepID=A0A1M5U163_9CLOT|nr:DUF2971 domain-containing protein [Clostridium intestinale]SHH56777.1 Protein of unknown function [Clostridium intestinale DSM 6191]
MNIYDKPLTEYKDSDYSIKFANYNTTLYHYTSIDGVMGILGGKKFRVSKAEFLNDSSEIIYILNTIYKSLKTIIKKDDSLGEIIINSLIEAIEGNTTHNGLRWYKNIMVDHKYILSLSLNRDSLMLWSNYSKFDGYNLGFDFYKLYNTFLDENSIVTHGKVLYKEKDQIKVIQKDYLNLLSIYNQYKDNLNINELSEFQREAFIAFYSRMNVYALFFKHDGFNYEEEYRVAITYKKKEVFYRTSNGCIIPYIETPINNSTLLPLTTITIGPKNNIDIAKSGIEHYIKSIGYKDIKISKSEIPLRY